MRHSREDLFHSKHNETDSACEEDISEEDLKQPESIIPQPFLDLADKTLSTLPPRWRNWITRVLSGISLISSFSFLVTLGPIGLFFLTHLVIFACFNEVLKMGQSVLNMKNSHTKWAWGLFGTAQWIVISPDLNIKVLPNKCF